MYFFAFNYLTYISFGIYDAVNLMFMHSA